MPRPNREEDFWSKVDKSGDCWLWTGGINHNGYGYAYFGNRKWRAHRLAWVLTHGPIPDGLEVCHSCDVRNCVKHLFLGTHSENMRDAANKRRIHSPHGSERSNSKLTMEEARQIRQCKDQGVPERKIASDFQVSRATVRRIIAGTHWKERI